MELEFIYENRLGKMEYDREKFVVHVTVAGIVNIPLAQELFEAVLSFAKHNKIRAGVYKCMAMKGTFTKFNPWLKDVYYPKMIAQGYFCWSLSTKDVFTQFAGNILINKLTPEGVSAKLFSSDEKAIQWTYDMLEKH